MDIIITGEQGAGKTTAAEAFIKNFRRMYDRRLHEAEVLFIHDMYNTPGLLVEMMRAARCRAVVFDGPIVDPESMLVAVAAVKEYRKQIGADILAVYVAPGEAVMLTNGVPRTNEFKTRRDFVDSPRFSDYMHKPMATRTDVILADLWELCVDKVDEAGRDQMEAMLSQLAQVDKDVTPGLHHLGNEEKMQLHEYLLTLLRKYE